MHDRHILFFELASEQCSVLLLHLGWVPLLHLGWVPKGYRVTTKNVAFLLLLRIAFLLLLPCCHLEVQVALQTHREQHFEQLADEVAVALCHFKHLVEKACRRQRMAVRTAILPRILGSRIGRSLPELRGCNNILALPVDKKVT